MSLTHCHGIFYILDCLDDVHIGGETVHLIKGSHTQSFNWTKWGIRMCFSENSLPSDETCEVDVKALVGGNFKFPSDCAELISAVYAISFTRKLAEPVRLEIQHCALLKEESQFKYLSFVKAPRIPPFEFSLLEGGSFDLNSQFGFIILEQFCLISIIRRINRYIFPNFPSYYIGQLYYIHGNTVNYWKAMFIATKGLNALQTVTIIIMFLTLILFNPLINTVHQKQVS